MENERLITIPERIYWLFKESAFERMDDLQTGLDGGYYEEGKAKLDALDRATNEVRPYEKNRESYFLFGTDKACRLFSEGAIDDVLRLIDVGDATLYVYNASVPNAHLALLNAYDGWGGCIFLDADEYHRLAEQDRFENHYECPECGHKWSDTWSAMCDDDCPECGFRHVSPYASDDLL